MTRLSDQSHKSISALNTLGRHSKHLLSHIHSHTVTSQTEEMSPYGSSSSAFLTAGQSVDGLTVENMASEDEDEPEKWSSAIVKLCKTSV